MNEYEKSCLFIFILNFYSVETAICRDTISQLTGMVMKR